MRATLSTVQRPRRLAPRSFAMAGTARPATASIERATRSLISVLLGARSRIRGRGYRGRSGGAGLGDLLDLGGGFLQDLGDPRQRGMLGAEPPGVAVDQPGQAGERAVQIAHAAGGETAHYVAHA